MTRAGEVLARLSTRVGRRAAWLTVIGVVSMALGHVGGALVAEAGLGAALLGGQLALAAVAVLPVLMHLGGLGMVLVGLCWALTRLMLGAPSSTRPRRSRGVDPA